MLVTVTGYREIAVDFNQRPLSMGAFSTGVQTATGAGALDPLPETTRLVRISTDTAIQLDIEGGPTDILAELFLPGDHWIGVGGGETLTIAAAAAAPGFPVSIDGDAVVVVAPGTGCMASATFTPTATPYGAGDIIGASAEFAFQLADGSAIPTGSIIRILSTAVKIGEGALQSGEGAYTLQGYSVTQPSAQADNDAWTLALGDLPSYRGAISLGVPADLGAALYVKTPNTNLDLKLGTASMWGRLVTASAFTPTAVAREVILYGMVL